MEELNLRKNIADNLRQYRARKRITQEQLAEKSNITQEYVYKIENEKVNPSIEVMYNLACALDITVNDLIY